MDKDSYILISDTNNKPHKFKLSEIANPIKWINHPIADISILKLTISKDVAEHYFKDKAIPLKMISNDRKAISRNTQLTVIGFPKGLGVDVDAEYFSPLTYRSFPSSGLITLNRFDIKTPQTFIILENPSVAGYSGGPVYDLSILEQGGNVTYIGATKLVGIIHGIIVDNTGGKLSAVTPSFYLFDLLK